jgi:hypothetical protein
MYRARGFWVRVVQEFGKQKVETFEPVKPDFTPEELDQEQRAIQSGGALTPQDVLDTDQDNRDEPCEYGHFGCATVEGGPCHDEQLSAREAKRVARRPAHTRPQCSDCGKENETAGHQDCPYPQDHP